MKSRLLSLGAAVFCLCLPASAQVQPPATFTNPVAVADLAVEPAIPVSGASNVAVSPDQRHLYVVTRTGSSGGLTVVDAATHAVESTVDLGEGIPFELAVSPDGTRVYVAISKISGSTVLAADSRVAVIDVSVSPHAVVAEVRATLASGTMAAALTGLAVHPSLPRVYVSDRSLHRLFVIDTNTNTVVADIPVAGGTLGSSGPVALAVTPDGTRLYVANRGIPTSTVATLRPIRFAEVDLATYAVTMIPSDLNPSGSLVMVAMSPDGRRLYAASQADTESRMSVIDTDPLSSTYRTESFITTAAVSALRGLAMTADGRHLFAAYPAGGVVMVIDTEENAVIREIGVGSNPQRIVTRHARGSRAFVANPTGLVPLALPAPVVSAADVLGDEAHPIPLIGTVSDADSASLTTVWTYAAIDNPAATCVIANPDMPSTTIVCNDNGSYTATLSADDGDNEPVKTTIAVTVSNRAPHAALSAPASVTERATFTVSLTNAADVSTVDAAAGFTYAFDCGDGFGVFGSLPAVSCTAPAYAAGSPAITVKAAFRDKDGGISEYAATLTVTVQEVSTPGEMRGNGFIRDDQAKYSFEFHARERARGNERATITIRIDEDGRRRRRGGPSRDDRFESRTVDFIAFSNDPSIRPGHPQRNQIDTVRFTGVGTWNGQRNYRYEAFAQDVGEAGRHRESIRVKIFAPNGALVAQFGGLLDGGNIRSMRIGH